ncbi:hypothetical protein [Rhizobium sp. Root651]|uniref:hypothetical protein n=1 Tax=Rhizobium sp. Root651 TaxID=1736577 RepID=UPI000714D145|nr:hypothetical protein [Rhizobium sp. Root651]KRA58146.1 hypothetical protein ASD85_16815 [Rhizobium sp. Root651]
MSESPNLDELDELVSQYVFSASFDGGVADERRAIHKWVEEAILDERKRCAETTDKYRKDDMAGGEARLVAAYIHREIMSAA